MAKGYVLAIDAGSSSLRCLVLDLQGGCLAFAARPMTYNSLPDNPWARQFDPQQVWKKLGQLVQEALVQARVKPQDILGLSVTSQREGMVLLDKEGKELYAGPNTDLRALWEGMAIDERFGLQIYATTGHLPSFLLAPAKLRWLKTNQPQIYCQIDSLLAISDWLGYKLCGHKAAEPAGVGELGLLDLTRRKWARELISLLELPPHIYPSLTNPGAKIGEVSSQAAAETGLAPGTAVVIAGPDTQCGLLGMGLKRAGEVGIIAGWSAPLQMVVPRPLWDPQRRLWSGCYLLPSTWVLESNPGETGSAYGWLTELLFHNQGMAYERLDGLVEGLPPGAEGVCAFLGPQRMDVGQLKLHLGGFLFPVPFTLGAVSPGHLARACLENIVFALKANYLQLQEVWGQDMGVVSLGGGLSRSRSFCQILADVLGRAVHVSPMAEVSGLGVGLCAAVGAGVYSSLEEALEVMVPQQKEIEPHPSHVAEYEELYQKWLTTGRRLEELGQEL